MSVASVITSADAWQRAHALGGLPVAVLKKFRDDRASRLAALVAYYAFFSLFPLLLALVSILGFLLESDPTLQDDVLDTVLARIPVIGAQLRSELHPLEGSGIALVIGLAGALWAGLGVTVALGTAFAEIWDVPRLEQPGGLKARARGLAVLAILGATLIAATLLARVGFGQGGSDAAERAAAVVGSVTVNLAVFLTVFALLTPAPRRIRDLLPGVGFAALAWLLLQSIGSLYVDHVIAEADATYGTFALVIGLLSWFWLASQLLLTAAEINVVLRWRLWPRGLRGELEPADREALRRFATATRRDLREQISVGFSDEHDG
jgi:YihY family inner membrane protein